MTEQAQDYTLEGLIGRMPQKTTSRMPNSVKWSEIDRANRRWPHVLVLRAWRGVEVGDVVAVERADLWRLQAAGAVFELAKAKDEQHDGIVIGNTIVPVVWREAPDPEAEDGIARWGELLFEQAIAIG
ncbi:MAG TPA: hypothetical protein PJ986_04130 [Gammaproteobacteria bacterium]|nr:hypothetical protein [Gammaproteobacteria bacterium]